MLHPKHKTMPIHNFLLTKLFWCLLALPLLHAQIIIPVSNVTVGGSHACVLLEAGNAKCWGYGYFGQLGYGNDGNIGDSSAEMGYNLTNIDLGTADGGAKYLAVQLVAGNHHTCALLNNGNVKCWGRNDKGQLGYGHKNNTGNEPNEMGDNLPPVDLGTGKTAVYLAAGHEHTCAILNDGKVKCWGDGGSGRLGNGGTANQGDEASEMGDSLQNVNLGTDTAVQITAGFSHTCVFSERRKKPRKNY
jgi:hypothetical protein